MLYLVVIFLEIASFPMSSEKIDWEGQLKFQTQLAMCSNFKHICVTTHKNWHVAIWLKCEQQISTLHVATVALSSSKYIAICQLFVTFKDKP